MQIVKDKYEKFSLRDYIIERNITSLIFICERRGRRKETINKLIAYTYKIFHTDEHISTMH